MVQVVKIDVNFKNTKEMVFDLVSVCDLSPVNRRGES